MHAHGQSLSVNNGPILLGNKLPIPNAMKESVMDVLHSTRPGAWAMKAKGFDGHSLDATCLTNQEHANPVLHPLHTNYVREITSI